MFVESLWGQMPPTYFTIQGNNPDYCYYEVALGSNPMLVHLEWLVNLYCYLLPLQSDRTALLAHLFMAREHYSRF